MVGVPNVRARQERQIIIAFAAVADVMVVVW